MKYFKILWLNLVLYSIKKSPLFRCYYPLYTDNSNERSDNSGTGVWDSPSLVSNTHDLSIGRERRDGKLHVLYLPITMSQRS